MADFMKSVSVIAVANEAMPVVNVSLAAVMKFLSSAPAVVGSSEAEPSLLPPTVELLFSILESKSLFSVAVSTEPLE